MKGRYITLGQAAGIHNAAHNVGNVFGHPPPPHYDIQYTRDRNLLNNQLHPHNGANDATLTRSIGAYIKHSNHPNCVYTSVSRFYDEIVVPPGGGQPQNVQHDVVYMTFIATRDIFCGEDILQNRGPGFMNDNRNPGGSGYQTYTYSVRPPRHPNGQGPRGFMHFQPRIPGGLDKVVHHGTPPPLPRWRYYQPSVTAGQQYDLRHIFGEHKFHNSF